MSDKPEGWNETLDDLIRAKSTYEEANSALKKKYGKEEGTLGGLTYREHKVKLFGGDKVDEDLKNLGEKDRVEKPKPKPRPAFTKQKQSAADSSKLAQIINMGLYQGMLPFCASRELKEEDVQEVNPGGAIVANITYYFPESKLDHPLIMLGVRIVILYIKFKSVCERVQKAVGRDGPKNPTPTGGLKPGMKTERRV